jgi:hypothetical protein
MKRVKISRLILVAHMIWWSMALVYSNIFQYMLPQRNKSFLCVFLFMISIILSAFVLGAVVAAPVASEYLIS